MSHLNQEVSRAVSKPLECTMFGGEGALAYNALMSALFRAAGGSDNEHVYKFIEETPKTSLVVELYNALKELGFEITPQK